MQPVPKIVIDRLKAAPPAVSHPDADILTAFAERSLSDRERATVLDHLARCGDCREIVALALPEAEAVQTAIGPVRGTIRPAWRWGFVAAGVVLVASVGYLQLRQRQPLAAGQSAPAELAKNEPRTQVETLARSESTQPPVERKKLTVPAAPAFVDSLDAAGAAKVVNQKKIVSGVPAAGTLQSPAVRGNLQQGTSSYHGAVTFGPSASNQQQVSNAQQANNQLNLFQKQTQPPHDVPAAAPVPFVNSPAQQKVPASSEVVEVQADTSTATLEAGNQAPSNLTILPAPASKQAGASADSDRVARAKAANVTVNVSAMPVVETETADVPINGRNLQAVVAGMPAQWMVTRTGALQRSPDKGRTWQVVDVTAVNSGLLQVSATPAAVGGATAAQAQTVEVQTAQVETARVKTKRSKDKSTSLAGKQDASQLIFHAVTATGADVWAGGSGGSLYHSADSGANWNRVAISSTGAVLTGDIIAVEFSDALHGKVSTSTGEVWTTSDAGQTWQKQ